MKSTRVLITLATALIGGFVFKLLHIPIPWLLGPMIAVLIGSSALKGKYEWPGMIRNTGMIIIGYTIGLSLTIAALKEMVHQFPYMLLMTALLLLYCAGIAFLVSKLSKTDYKTALMGSIPGGLTQMIILAEETKGINLTVVTVTQVVRLMMIVISIPLLIFSPIFSKTTEKLATPLPNIVTEQITWSSLFPNILIFAVVCVICAIVGNKINFPTAFLLGPAIGTAIVQNLGLHGPTLPALIINIAQLMIGSYVGLLLKPNSLINKVQTISLSIGSGFLLILGAMGLSYLLSLSQPISRATALLSLAPGGMDQMGVIAHEIHANLSFVAGYQLFRTFFIFFLVPPLLRMLFKINEKRHSEKG